jgi:nitrite reductase/ring-hydroxylating ferredoxin subunit/uncharacterized membrane protein
MASALHHRGRMRSYASVKGHPIHPMLIVYPFALLTGAFGFNVAAAVSRRRVYRIVAQQLVPVGVASGLVAAVPGVLDYLHSVPPRSSGKTRATRHALLNTSALGLFTMSWLMNRRRAPRGVPLVLQGIASAALSVAGYMGGTLAYRNQIGVDHRYAGAGTWRELAEGSAALTDGIAPEGSEANLLARAAEGVGVDQMRLVHTGGRRIAVGRTEHGVAAFDDRCTHRGGPLSDGVLICGTVQCPWHGSQFDVKTGAVKCGPATEPIRTYDVAASAATGPSARAR